MEIPKAKGHSSKILDLTLTECFESGYYYSLHYVEKHVDVGVGVHVHLHRHKTLPSIFKAL